MRMPKIYILLLVCLLYSFNASSRNAPERDSSWYRYRAGARTTNLLPLFGGRIIGDATHRTVTEFLLGAQVGYGIFLKDRFCVGAHISYDHLFLKNLKDANRIEAAIYSEYLFWPGSRFSPLIGIRGKALYWQYHSYPNFRYMNDAPDTASHSHILPVMQFYAGASLKCFKRCTIQLGAGYSHVFTNNTGDLPEVPLYINLDFRIFRWPSKRAGR